MCFRLAPTTMTHCRALCPKHTHLSALQHSPDPGAWPRSADLRLLLLPAHVSCCCAPLSSPALCSAQSGDSGSTAPISSASHRQRALVLCPLHPCPHSKIPPHPPGCQTPGTGWLLGPYGTTWAGLHSPCAPPAPLSTWRECPLPQYLPRAHCHLSCYLPHSLQAHARLGPGSTAHVSVVSSHPKGQKLCTSTRCEQGSSVAQEQLASLQHCCPASTPAVPGSAAPRRCVPPRRDRAGAALAGMVAMQSCSCATGTEIPAASQDWMGRFWGRAAGTRERPEGSGAS